MLQESEIQKLLTESKELLDSFDLKDLKNQQGNLESKISEPDIWDDNQLASKLNQELSGLNQLLEELEILEEKIENLNIALELNEEEGIQRIYYELEKLKTQIEKQKFLDGKFDKNDCVLTIHAGAGGVDAQDWAAMLVSMYESFCSNQGWGYKLINLSTGEEAGVKTATLEIKGNFAYGLLKEEAGVHRLVRISPFNSGGTRETSFALVEVIPLGINQDLEIKIDEKDLKWDYFMASGKGGQSVNTTYSAVRLTHLPSKIVVSCQNERSQLQNKQIALEYLKDKLAALELQKQQEFKQELRGEYQSAEWGNQIRNYVLHPYKLVKDTRSGYEISDTSSVLENGEILDIIWSVKIQKQKNEKLEN